MTAVEVWWGRIGQVRDEFAEELDALERQRLEAYVRGEDKARFLLGCTIVRRLLAARLSLPAAKISLDRSCPECGRPHGKVRADGVELSVTHSGDLVGVALHPRTAVGLDVERIDPAIDADAIAGVSLAAVEMRELRRYDGVAKARAFTQYWTRKEAIVKATGNGIRTDLRTVIVSPPDQPAQFLSGGLQLIDLEVDEDYAAALAVASAEPPVVRMEDATKLLRS
jgi:4'-phosphopantetheinyl transferase